MSPVRNPGVSLCQAFVCLHDKRWGQPDAGDAGPTEDCLSTSTTGRCGGHRSCFKSAQSEFGVNENKHHFSMRKRKCRARRSIADFLKKKSFLYTIPCHNFKVAMHLFLGLPCPSLEFIGWNSLGASWHLGKDDGMFREQAELKPTHSSHTHQATHIRPRYQSAFSSNVHIIQKFQNDSCSCYKSKFFWASFLYFPPQQRPPLSVGMTKYAIATKGLIDKLGWNWMIFPEELDMVITSNILKLCRIKACQTN